MNIFISQKNFRVGDIDYNLELIIQDLKSLNKKTDVYLTPELALTGYPAEDLLNFPFFIISINKAIIALCKQSSNLNGCLIAVGAPTIENDKLYNSILLIQDGKVLGFYNKGILINKEVFDEKRFFTCGTESKVIDLKSSKIGFLICEDVWHDDPVEDAVQKGAQILLVANASPYFKEKLSLRHRRVNYLTKRFGISLVYVNLVGGQDELVFDGASFVSARGKIIYQLPQFEEYSAYFNLSLLNSKPIIFKNISINEQLIQCLILGTRDYINKNKFKNVVIGLSGGIDSALVTYIACLAIGPQNVTAVMMPSVYTSKLSVELSRKLIKNLTIKKYHEIPIDSLCNEYSVLLTPYFKNKKIDTTEENIQSRVRGNLLMAFANKFNSLVLTTGNKSETAVGYSTIYGDMAGGFSVIKDLLKTEVYSICRFINKNKEVIPKKIITRKPSAELRFNQIDQDSLPPYKVLDRIIALHLEKSLGSQSISKMLGIQIKDVKKILNLIKINEFKRRQSAPGVKISKRAFGKDWRMPITNGYKF